MTYIGRSYAFPTVLAVCALVGGALIVGNLPHNLTLNAMAKEHGYTNVKTLPERDLRVRSRVRAWVGNCPVEITLHKGNERKFAVWFNGKDGLTPMSYGNAMPVANDAREELLYGKAAKNRGVTKVTDKWIYPPYLCDPRKPHKG